MFQLTSQVQKAACRLEGAVIKQTIVKQMIFKLPEYLK